MTDKLRRPEPTLEPLLDIADVARIFKTSPKSVRRMIARGELPSVRIGKLRARSSQARQAAYG